MRATYPAHLSHLDLRFLIMLDEEYNACSSVLCNFLYSPVISSLLATNIFLCTLFLNTLNLCSSLKVRDQVSQPYNITGNISPECRKWVNRNLHFLWYLYHSIAPVWYNG